MEKQNRPGLLRRLAAIVYDTCLVLPLVMLVIALATGLQIAITGEQGELDYSATLHPLIVQLLALCSVSLFFGYFWRLKGQTLGMQAWRIKLRVIDGSELSYWQVLLRCLGAALSLAAAGAGYWWCLFDRNGRCWHDYLSGTELELLPKRA
ncbi:MAG: RDD family protein [Halieaceae bacterium]